MSDNTAKVVNHPTTTDTAPPVEPRTQDLARAHRDAWEAGERGAYERLYDVEKTRRQAMRPVVKRIETAIREGNLRELEACLRAADRHGVTSKKL